MVQYTRSTTTKELEQILALQLSNHKSTVSKEVAQKEGFVTVMHDLAILQKMNTPHPHIIAKDGDDVIGYAIVMETKWRNEVEELEPMFGYIDSIDFKGAPLKDLSYFTMGQVCIHENYRGQGVFTGLYETMAKAMSPHYDYILTEVSSSNHRSLRAHEKVGFEVVDRYFSGDNWVVILWDISEASIN